VCITCNILTSYLSRIDMVSMVAAICTPGRACCNNHSQMMVCCGMNVGGVFARQGDNVNIVY